MTPAAVAPTVSLSLYLPLSPSLLCLPNIVWQLLPAAANNNWQLATGLAGPNAKRVNIMFYFYLFHLLLVTFADFFWQHLKGFYLQLVGAVVAATVSAADLK